MHSFYDQFGLSNTSPISHEDIKSLYAIEEEFAEAPGLFASFKEMSPENASVHRVQGFDSSFVKRIVFLMKKFLR